MPASDIVRALEAHLITKIEALEQANIESLDALYEKAARKTSRWFRQGDTLFLTKGR